jgi:hypothetical protein
MKKSRNPYREDDDCRLGNALANALIIYIVAFLLWQIAVYLWS